MRKPKLSEIAFEVIEIGEDSFPDSTKLEDLEGLFKKLRFGEVVIKVIDGNVESIQVTHHYKPMISDEKLDKEEEVL
jgi:hypothetical protein